MTKLETWRSGTWTTWPGTDPAGSADETIWGYGDWHSQPNTKIYEAGSGEAAHRKTVRYLYHPNGSLKSREWQRTGAGTAGSDVVDAGVKTLYEYDSFARLTKVDYPTPGSPSTFTATPDVIFAYDGAGRIFTRTDGAGTTTYTWMDWGVPSKESLLTNISGVTQVTAEVERTFETTYKRLDLLKAKWGTASGMTAPDVDHGYDSNGFLNSISTAGRSVTPALASGSMQWGTLTFKNNTTALMTATRTLDSAGRTNYMAYAQGGTMFRTLTYTYDRDRVKNVVHDKAGTATPDEMTWVYDYNSKGEVTNADKRFSTNGSYTGNFLAGYQTGYTFDEAGNRSAKDEGGTDTGTEGTDVRPTSYTPNALNQYTSITNPSTSGGTVQTFDVTGRRSSGSPAVTVNTQAASYQANTSTGLHYHKAVTHTATTGAGSFESVTVQEAGTTIDSGNFYLPPPAETLTYDADGNLTQDGRWTYSWDAENRLTGLTYRHTASSTYPGLKLTFGYDGLSRRTWKKVESTTNGTTWTTDSLETFLYDGWNLLMRVGINTSGTAVTRQTYVWGPDVASLPTAHASWQRAGGVGGLLMVLDKDATAYTSTGDNFFPLMDRMGNIFGYRSSDTGSTAALSAVYEYDAFGREMKSLGSAADKMPFRFSSKFTDIESGLVYYGFRYFDPQPGRWINRDPIGEVGGMNLFRTAANVLVMQLDVIGRSTVELTTYAPKPDYKLDPGRNPFDGGQDMGFTLWTCDVKCTCVCDKDGNWWLRYKLIIDPKIRLRVGMSSKDKRETYGHEQRHILSGFNKILDQVKPEMDKLDKNHGANEKECKADAIRCWGNANIRQKCDKKLNEEKDHAGDATATQFSPGGPDGYDPLPNTPWDF